jgi:phage terminase large subunit-like protein
MRRMAKQAREIPAFENTFRRYRLNQWTRQETRWLPLEKWDAAAGEVDANELLGMKCYVGLDMASTTDIAALVCVFPYGDSFKVLPFFFVPAENAMERSRKDRVPYETWINKGHIEATEGNVIDYKAIKQKLKLLATMYEIVEVAFDRWGMTQLSQELDDEGFVMVPFGQGFASMSAPSKELLGLVLSKKIHHGGNPVLRWMADNLTIRQDPAGNIKPDKSTSKEKIDGMVAMIMGLDRAIRHKKGTSVYDERGMRTL